MGIPELLEQFYRPGIFFWRLLNGSIVVSKADKAEIMLLSFPQHRSQRSGNKVIIQQDLWKRGDFLVDNRVLKFDAGCRNRNRLIPSIGVSVRVFRTNRCYQISEALAGPDLGLADCDCFLRKANEDAFTELDLLLSYCIAVFRKNALED